MKVGIELVFGATPEQTMHWCGEIAALVEDLGFSSLWAPDHVVLFENYAPNYSYSPDGQAPLGTHGWLDPLWVLAAAASTTNRIRLGTGILILPQRNPVILAKELVALDHLTGGRLDVGVGVGWSPEEYAALGVPFENRGARADEYLDAMNMLWFTTPSTFEGTFVSFRDAVALPQPAQRPRPPIWIGGQSAPALRRAAARGDGWVSWMVAPHDLADTHREADRACEKAGRDPATLRRIHTIAYTDPRAFAEYVHSAEALGAEEVVAVPFVPDRPLDDVLAEIATVAGGQVASRETPPSAARMT